MLNLNYNVIASNIAEAREELERIEAQIKSDDKPDEGELTVAFGHAYHHLNMAWNARYVMEEKYRNLTDADFNSWSKFPSDILEYEV